VMLIFIPCLLTFIPTHFIVFWSSSHSFYCLLIFVHTHFIVFWSSSPLILLSFDLHRIGRCGRFGRRGISHW
jgi:hypothetical protein